MTDQDSTVRAEVAYSRIKRAILGLELRPGERISERRLEGILEASRTPVRAALLRLQTEDLVQRDGNSWQVTPLDYDELLEAFEFRYLIEIEAVMLATRLGVSADFEKLDAILTESEALVPAESFLPQTAMFHVEIARMSQNRFLLRSTVEVLERLVRARMLTLTIGTTRSLAEDAHRSIAAAMRTGKATAAAKLMKAHLAWTRELLVAGIAERRRTTVLQGAGTTLRSR